MSALDLTVMGPAEVSPEATNPADSPLTFTTNVTSKVQYWDALHTWAMIARDLIVVYKKAKARVASMGLIVYLACDGEEKANLRAAEMEGRLCLQGTEADAKRQILIEELISTIAKNTQTETIRLEVSLLGHIHTCHRNIVEPAEKYANRFETHVAR